MGTTDFDVKGWTSAKKDSRYTEDDLRGAFTFYTHDLDIKEKPYGTCIAGVVNKDQVDDIKKAWKEFRRKDKDAIDSLQIEGIDKSCLERCADNYGPACALVVKNVGGPPWKIYPPVDDPVRVDFFGSFHS